MAAEQAADQPVAHFRRTVQATRNSIQDRLLEIGHRSVARNVCDEAGSTVPKHLFPLLPQPEGNQTQLGPPCGERGHLVKLISLRDVNKRHVQRGSRCLIAESRESGQSSSVRNKDPGRAGSLQCIPGKCGSRTQRRFSCRALPPKSQRRWPANAQVAAANASATATSLSYYRSITRVCAELVAGATAYCVTAYCVTWILLR